MLNHISVSFHFSFFLVMALFTCNVEDLFTCVGSNFTKLISSGYLESVQKSKTCVRIDNIVFLSLSSPLMIYMYNVMTSDLLLSKTNNNVVKLNWYSELKCP